jgi:hypothetical protein
MSPCLPSATEPEKAETISAQPGNELSRLRALSTVRRLARRTVDADHLLAEEPSLAPEGQLSLLGNLDRLDALRGIDPRVVDQTPDGVQRQPVLGRGPEQVGEVVERGRRILPAAGIGEVLE